MKILHTGDLHLGNFPGPETAGGNARFLDIRALLHDLVSFIEKETPDLVIIAGDLFNQARVWSSRGLEEQSVIATLIRDIAKISPVIAIRGTASHDAKEQIMNLENTFLGDDRIHIWYDTRSQTIDTGAGKIHVTAIPGFDRADRSLPAGLGPDEENRLLTEELNDAIIDQGQKVTDHDIPSILVSHYTTAGANMESGQQAFFGDFEPVIDPKSFDKGQYDLVCLGHIHRPQKIDHTNVPAYYCGALCQLTFNDEDQPRGFWIHDIQSDKSVKSTFVKMNSRQFHTLYMDQADIQAFLDTGLVGLSNTSITNSIVRLRYDCDPVTEKELSISRLQNALYRKGAFYVQGVTKAKKTVTASKQDLDIDIDPVTALAAWTKDKAMDQVTRDRLSELAKPLIEKARNQTDKVAATGLFTPMAIAVKNYRNYKKGSFDFSSIRFCTINGANGAGKSSLFMDAILDALYEEPREGELTGWISNDEKARSGSITFDFDVADTHYRVIRGRTKSGKASLDVQTKDDAGNWKSISAGKIKDTQAMLEQIIGMDSLTLRSCALIMQDQYGLFLQATSDQRMKVLADILGLEIYDRLELSVTDLAKGLRRDIKTCHTRIEELEASDPDRSTRPERLAAAKGQLDLAKHQYQLALEGSQNMERTATANKRDAEEIARNRAEITDIDSQLQRNLRQQQKTEKDIENATVLQARKPDIDDAVAKIPALEKTVQEWILEDAARQSARKELASAINVLTSRRQSLEQLEQMMQDIKAREKQATDFLSHRDAIEKNYTMFLELQNELAKMLDVQKKIQERDDMLRQEDLAHQQAIADIQLQQNRIANRIEDIERREILLQDAGCIDIEHAACTFLADAIRARTEKKGLISHSASLDDQIKAELKRHEETMTRIRSDYRDLPDTMPDVITLNRQTEALRPAAAAKKDLERAADDLERLQASASGLVPKIDSVQKDITNQESVVKDLQEKLPENDDDILTGLSKARNELAKTKTTADLTADLAAADARISSGHQMIQVLKDQAMDLAMRKEQAAQRVQKLQLVCRPENEIQALVAKSHSELQAANARCEELMQTVTMLEQAEKNGARIQVRIDTLQKEIKELAGQLHDMELLQQAFSQEGIPHQIVTSILPQLESVATTILQQMSQGAMSVGFVTSRTLKSNKKKEVTTLDVIINDIVTGALPYASRSGGEKVKAALAVILAISEIKSRFSGLQLGMLFIDEPPFLDGPGISAYADALDTIRKRYPDIKVMAITHDESLKTRFAQNITITKDNAGSHVNFG